jgi:hypothetical protein
VRLVGAQADEVSDREDLQEGLELAEALGLEDLAGSSRHETETGDEEFADQDEDDAEGRQQDHRGVGRDRHAGVVPARDRQAVDRGEADEQAEDEDLVDQRVHQASEVGHGVQLGGRSSRRRCPSGPSG